MLAVLVCLLIFVVVATMATILIKILIEFPGLLRFKCIYSEGPEEEEASDDLEEGTEFDINSVLEQYENQVRKHGKCKIHLDNEDLPQTERVRRQRYKHKHKARPRKNEKQIEETTNDEDISIEIEEDRPDDIDIPTQLTIKVGKSVRVEQCEGRERTRRVEHHKHGHVRQH